MKAAKKIKAVAKKAKTRKTRKNKLQRLADRYAKMLVVAPDYTTQWDLDQCDSIDEKVELLMDDVNDAAALIYDESSADLDTIRYSVEVAVRAILA